MERDYIVFVPEQKMDEDTLEHSDVVNWAYENKSHFNVLLLNINDLHIIQNEGEIINIINEENEGMLQEGEDDWIIYETVKLNILKRLINYSQTLKKGREKDIANALLRLLEISIKTKKNLYFIF